MDRSLLEPEDIERALDNLEGWALAEDGKSIRREFNFADFPAAFAFMTHVAFEAEKADHHPDWSNVYNRVDVTLNTHDAGGVTALDIQLAERMNDLA